MQLHISMTDGLTIYQPIVNRSKYRVASGRLNPGDELPAIRALAERLVVNPSTVARAYRELEVAGVVTKQRATGTHSVGGRLDTRPNGAHPDPIVAHRRAAGGSAPVRGHDC